MHQYKIVFAPSETTIDEFLTEKSTTGWEYVEGAFGHPKEYSLADGTVVEGWAILFRKEIT